YFELSDAEKLSLPSFSRFVAGLEIGGDALELPSQIFTTNFQYDTTIFDSVPSPPAQPYVLALAAQLAMNGRAMASPRALRRYAPLPGTPSRVSLPPDRWVIAGTDDLTLHPEIDSDGSKLGAQLALARFLAANVTQRGQLQVVLAEEAA